MINDKSNVLNNYLNDIVKQDIVPGIVVSIVKQNSREIFYSGTMDGKQMVSAETIYDLASVSKVVGTTTAILKLIEENSINLDTKVSDILPKYKFDSTILDLLTHQSGLPGDDKAYRNAKNRNDFIEFLYQLDLVYKPNTKVVYSDFGFNLLGLIIETFKGNLEDYLREILFQPLQMITTTYNPATLKQNLIAPTEKHLERGLIKGVVMDGKAAIMSGLSGNAGLFSNINDLSNFAAMILNDGKYLNSQILSKKTIEMFKSSYTKELDVNRSLGWAKKDSSFSQGFKSGDNIIYHTGFSGPMILIDFNNEIAIVCLTNRTFPNRSETRIIEERNILIDNIYKYLDK